LSGPRTTYHERVLRDVRRRAALRLVPVVGALMALAACGEPPAPPSSAPPEPTGSSSAGASASAYAPGVVPTVPTTLPTVGVLPTGGVPPAYTPYTPYTPPATTVPTPATTTPRTPGPSPAPKCTAGPSGAQVVAVVKGTAGIPDRELKVIDGPFCSGTWQISTIEIVARDAEQKYEPLFVVTTGTPAALQLVEAGTDVCSQQVQNDAPGGIRVRACGT
jgi:hypothetical protein